MATVAQINVIDSIRNLANLTKAYKNEVRWMLEMYANEGVASISQEELTAILPGVTLAELQGAKNAHSELNTALGEFTAGTIITRLAKLINNPA